MIPSVIYIRENGVCVQTIIMGTQYLPTVDMRKGARIVWGMNLQNLLVICALNVMWNYIQSVYEIWIIRPGFCFIFFGVSCVCVCASNLFILSWFIFFAPFHFVMIIYSVQSFLYSDPIGLPCHYFNPNGVLCSNVVKIHLIFLFLFFVFSLSPLFFLPPANQSSILCFYFFNRSLKTSSMVYMKVLNAIFLYQRENYQKTKTQPNYWMELKKINISCRLIMQCSLASFLVIF